MTQKNLSDLVIRHSEFKGQIGVARADITPPAGIYARSWGSALHDAAEGIHRPLVATCLFFRGGDPELELYLLCFDLGWWYDNAHEREIRDRILEKSGIHDDQLVTHMGHTHAGPASNLQNLERQGGHLIPAYRDKIVEGAVAALKGAKANVQPAVATWAQGRCDLARNRDLVLDSETFLCGINPEGPTDDTVLVGRVTNASGKIIATLVNYACHPVSLGGGNRMISPDYYGAMREVVERDTGGAPCLFLHGASGDMTPLRSYEADTAIADQNGRQLGYAALSALTGMLPAEQELAFDRIEDSGARLGRWSLRPKPASTKLAVMLSDSELAYVDLPTEVELLEALKTCTDRPLKERLERRLMVRRDVGEGKSRKVRMTLWQIGDAFLVGAPAEPYSAFQKEIRARFPGHAVMVLNIVNGNIGYLAPAETYDKPGLYQIKISLFRPGCMEQVIEDTAKSLRELETAHG
jgi:Neutral/alkaline non-lysosomal ceramidase, N-terminal